MAQKQILPPGEYALTDPCYVIDNDKWHEFLDPYWGTGRGGVFEFEGHKCAAFSTLYGDGVYDSNQGHALGVDAGLIGLIPMELCVKGDEGGHNIIVLTEETECWRDDNGTIHFGKDLFVPTGDDDEYCDHCGR